MRPPKTIFILGDRVQLSALGKKRSPRMRVQTGKVVGLPKCKSGGGTIDVLLDGNRLPTRIHRSYLEPESATTPELDPAIAGT